jgi:hypothetical protein
MTAQVTWKQRPDGFDVGDDGTGFDDRTGSGIPGEPTTTTGSMPDPGREDHVGYEAGAVSDDRAGHLEAAPRWVRALRRVR